MKLIFTFITFFVFTYSFIAQVNEQWVERFTSADERMDRVNDMFIDAAGNVYVTGSQREGPYPEHKEIEAVTVKYNPQGVMQWIQNYTAIDSNGAFGKAIHVDAAGNVYITGETAIYSGGGNQTLIIKYSPDGTQLWSYKFNYVGNTGTIPFDIITDAEGNVYVTGEYNPNVIYYSNIFLIKLSPSGSVINQTFYHSNSEGARKIALDGAGKIIIGGYINADTLSFVALKYEQNLDFVWAAKWGIGIGNQNEIDMAIDNNSNIFLAGTNSGAYDFSTVKISPQGTVLWGKNYSVGATKARAVVSDNQGYIYVTGESGNPGFPGTYDFCTIKYSPDGNEEWVIRTDSADSRGQSAYDIAIDNASNVYITGNDYSNSDIRTIKYNSAGELQWDISYNGTGNSSDLGVAVGVDENGNVYTAGNSIDTSSGQNIVIIKYDQIATNVNEQEVIPGDFKLEQNYPNPFNPSTNIEFYVPASKAGISHFVILKVYDILGNETAVLVNEEKPAGLYKIKFDGGTLSSGVYFCQLKVNSFIETRKMILMK